MAKAHLEKYHVNKLILLIGLICVLVTSIYLFILAKQANVETLKSGLSQSTVIYDKKTKKLAHCTPKGTYVELNAISPYIQDAVISTEDRNFTSITGLISKGLPVQQSEWSCLAEHQGAEEVRSLSSLPKCVSDIRPNVWSKSEGIILAIEIERSTAKKKSWPCILTMPILATGYGVSKTLPESIWSRCNECYAVWGCYFGRNAEGPGIYNPIDHPKMRMIGKTQY